MDSILTAEGSSWIEDNWYQIILDPLRSGFYQLMCGAYKIDDSINKENLDKNKSLHKKLRLMYSEDGLAKQLISKSKELDETTLEITQRLREFSDIEHLTGYCALECRS
jgi:hypothetical protein